MMTLNENWPMTFQVKYPESIRTRLLRLQSAVTSVGLQAEFVEVLKAIHKRLEDSPLEWGEQQYTLRHVQLPICIIARRFLSVNYAVDVIQRNVMVTKMRMLDDHPFPAGFEKILNDI